MRDDDILYGDPLEEPCLTLEEVASMCAVAPEWLADRVASGLLPATGDAATQWRFTSTAVLRVRRMRDLERNFDAVPELAALVADLLEALDATRARLLRG
jgi:chaperone modulatory protein CbpM